MRLDPRRHKKAGDFLRYHLQELEAVTGGNRFQAVLPDGQVVFEGRAKTMLEFLRKINGPRASRRDGMAGIASLEASCKYAMKAGGLLKTPRDAYREFAPTLVPMMQVFAGRAVAQTTRRNPKTGKREKAFVPVLPLFLIAPANNTRSGEAEVAVDFQVVKKGWDPVGKKWRSIDFDKLMHAQGEAQGAHNAAVGFMLRDHGIVCVPNGKSIAAVGYTARPQGAAKMAAAGAAGQNVGPGAAAAAAQNIAAGAGKRLVDWDEAVERLMGTVNAALTRAVSGLLVKVDESVQEWMAAGAVRAAVKLHRATGAVRFSEGSVKAAAYHLGMPHVRPDVLARVWGEMTAEPKAFGIREVELYPDGTRMFAPISGQKVERDVGRLLVAAGQRNTPGLTKAEVVGSFAARGLTAAERDSLYELCGKGGLRWADRYDPKLLPQAAEAYERSGRRVYAVGDPAVARAVGTAGWSTTGFVDSATRTGHLRSLWLGLKARGPFGDWLGAAEHIRAAKPRIQVRKGDLVILSPASMGNARGVRAVLRVAQKRGATVVMAGPAAGEFRALWQAEVRSQAQKQARGAHL